MSSSSLGGPTLLGRVLAPSLDTILKNVSWRQHPSLVSACKSTLDHLQTLTLTTVNAAADGGALILTPLLLAVNTAAPKIVDAALTALFRLLSLDLIEFSLSGTGGEGRTVISELIEAVCKSAGLGDETIEFSVLKTVLAAVKSRKVRFDGDYLNYIVRTCYNVYLGGLNGTNQICAKAVLGQIVLIVFSRVEIDSMTVVAPKIVSVSELLEFSDRNLSEGNSVQLAQGLINEVMLSSNNDSDDVEEEKAEEEGIEGGVSRLREDGFAVFKNLCKLSMKFSSQDHNDDGMVLRGKILSLELLKVIMDNSGPVWGSNVRQVSRFGFTFLSFDFDLRN